MRALRLVRIGDALGVQFPPDVIERMEISEGETLYLTEAPDGAVKLTAYNPEYDLQMKALRVGMFKYNKTLKALSK